MSEKTAYAAYQAFLALKQHFSKGKYDYFRYNGRIRSNLNRFRERKDRYYFEKLTRKYSESELINFFVSNLIINPDVWVGELCRDKTCEERYKEWKRKKESLTYVFQSDIMTIKDLESDFDELFVCKPNEYPKLIDLYTEGAISLETLIGFDLVLGCFGRWNRTIGDDIIWKDLYHLCFCYRPFLNYDVKTERKFRTILQKEFLGVKKNTQAD